jgi:hypothetical protein
VLSAAGDRLAYGALKGDKWVVVVDGQESEPADGIGAKMVFFSPDGKHSAYACTTAHKWSVVLDKQKPAPCDVLICSPAFAADDTLNFIAINDGKLCHMTLSP